jgi:hypothetical protein
LEGLGETTPLIPKFPPFILKTPPFATNFYLLPLAFRLFSLPSTLFPKKTFPSNGLVFSSLTQPSKKTEQKEIKTFGSRENKALLCTRFERGTPLEATVSKGF